MNSPALYLGTTHAHTNFGAFWVHLQDTADKHATPFKIVIPNQFLEKLLDPHGDRGPTSFGDFLMSRIEEFGTFVAEGYFKSFAEAAGETPSNYSWVVAAVDRAFDGDDGLVIEGRAVPFDSARV